MTQFAHCIAGLFISISAGAAVQGQAPMDANGARQTHTPPIYPHRQQHLGMIKARSP